MGIFGFPKSEGNVNDLIFSAKSVKSRARGKVIKKLYQLGRSAPQTVLNDYNPSS